MFHDEVMYGGWRCGAHVETGTGGPGRTKLRVVLFEDYCRMIVGLALIRG